MACTEVIEPFLVDVMRSCSSPISDSKVGWYPTADGMRPNSADTSEPACVKRKMLSTKNSTSWPSSSRKYSARVRPDRPTRARAGRLVHLAVDESRLGALAIHVDDARFDHLVIEVVALAGALADPGEHRIAAMRLGDVVDQFHDDDGLADPGAAEQPDLAALRVGREQIDDLDAGHQDFGLGRLVDEFGRRPMDRQAAVGDDRAAFVNRLADHVEDA